MTPGELFLAKDDITINADRESISIMVANTADRPIQIGSHYHFYEVNGALKFDREKAYGMRLDIPAGTAVRFEPGLERQVNLIPYKGKRVACGFRALVNGKLDK